MAITNADVLNYIIANRIFNEDATNLLQEKADTLGRDAVSAALLWIMGRFIKAGRTDLFISWRSAIYSLDSSDLTNLDTIRSTLNIIDSENGETYAMIFESLIQLSISNMYEDSGQDGEATTEKKEAQELIEALIGNAADPSNTVDHDSEDSVVSIYNLTDTEIKTALKGFE